MAAVEAEGGVDERPGDVTLAGAEPGRAACDAAAAARSRGLMGKVLAGAGGACGACGTAAAAALGQPRQVSPGPGKWVGGAAEAGEPRARAEASSEAGARGPAGSGVRGERRRGSADPAAVASRHSGPGGPRLSVALRARRPAAVAPLAFGRPSLFEP